MAGTFAVELAARVRALERQVRLHRALAGLLLVAALAAGFVRSQDPRRAPAPDGVLRVRGLVVEDEKGRPRVLLGAPVAALAGRRRSDPALGMVVLDEAGRDRLQVGNVGGPQMGGTVQPRIAGCTGIMLCDLGGEERGGFGFLDNGRTVLGMDDPADEGVMLFLAPDLGRKGLVVNERVGDRTVQRLFLGVDTRRHESLLKLQDGAGVERVQVVAPADEVPRLVVTDGEGQELADILEER